MEHISTSWFTTSRGRGPADGTLPGAKDIHKRLLSCVGTWENEVGEGKEEG